MITDFPTLTYSRIYSQYRDKPKAVEWYLINANIGNEILTAYNDVTISYDIDLNEGAQLDVIGRVVDIDRSIVDSIVLDVYEFGNAGNEFGWDEVQFSPLSISQDSEISDQYFRVLLKSKVAKNTSNATIDSIIQATVIILGGDRTVFLRDNEDMTFSIEIYDGLTDIERELLGKDIIPKPQGVRLRGILDGEGIAQFGDDSLEFGDETAEFIGFIEA